MLRMQQEAVERVRQMQERARKYVDDDREPVSSKPGVQPASVGHDRPLSFPPPSMPPAPPDDSEHKKGLSFLAGFGDDREQLFLLLIVFVLIRNDAPIELILALLYIAM